MFGLHKCSYNSPSHLAPSLLLAAITLFGQTANAEPSLSIGVGLRTGLSFTLEDPEDDPALTLDHSLGEANVLLYLTGQLTENVSFLANFESDTQYVALLDAVIRVKFLDAFQIWLGQHIPATDRNNFNGPYYTNAWNYPITIQTYPFDISGRDRGATIWGLLLNNRLKYHLSIVDLQVGRKFENARYSGRLAVHFLEPEAYYYNSGSYYGDQDTLTIGVTGQYQKGVDIAGVEDPDNDFVGFSFDLFFEKTFGEAGTLTVDGQYFSSEESGENYLVNQLTVTDPNNLPILPDGVGPGQGSSYMIGLGWLIGHAVGPGKFQPLARFEYGNPKQGPSTSTFDASLGYIIDGFNHKYYANYRHQEVGAQSVDIVQVGAQFQLTKTL